MKREIAEKIRFLLNRIEQEELTIQKYTSLKEEIIQSRYGLFRLQLNYDSNYNPGKALHNKVETLLTAASAPYYNEEGRAQF